jgi:putative phosphonate metabolism protein
MFARYAIYVSLPDSPLQTFGTRWLGWDIVSGETAQHPDIDGIDVSSITATPRKYGFHGTMKPPFRLATGVSEDQLRHAFAAFCDSQPPAVLDGLELTTEGPFLALTPIGNPEALSTLAARVVGDFDGFRAPASECEMARRRKRPLSAAEEANLIAWGYPYVMDCFRFHITLTGPLAPDLRDHVKAALSERITPLLPERFEVGDLALCGEDEEGFFHLIQKSSLKG